MKQTNTSCKSAAIDKTLMIPSLIVTLLISIPLVVFQEQGTKIVTMIFNGFTFNFKWLFLIYGFFCVTFIIWLSFSKWGKVKFGAPEDKPEYSTYKWIAMMFCAGIGISLARWAFFEPAAYIGNPPMGIVPNSSEAAEWAGMLGQFHWGLTPWSIYALPAFPIAYAIHVKKLSALRFSTACKGILGKKADGIIGKIIDVLVIFGMIGGIGTSLGLAVPLVSALIAHFLGLSQSVFLQMAVLLAFVGITCISVFLGLQKGIAKLYDIKTYLAYFLLVFVLIAGPTIFILNTWVNSIGLMVQNFIRLSLFTDPISHTGFTESWTVFYWSWWISYSPMMGLFVAKISKGRTIRELAICELTFASLGNWMFFAVWGGYSINLQVNNILNLTQLIKELPPEQTIVAILNTLPLEWLIIPVYAILCLVFLSGTISSSAYTLASQVQKKISGDEEPRSIISVTWTILLGIYAAGLLLTGGITSVQLSSVMLGFPLIFITIIMVMSLMKWLHEDYGPILKTPKIALDPKDIKPVK